METQDYIKKRYAQEITDDELDMFKIPEKCRKCPMIAIEYVEKRNRSIDTIASESHAPFDKTSDLLKDFRSPTSGTTALELHEAVDELVEAVSITKSNEDFYAQFAEYLDQKGLLNCGGLIEFDETLAYPRRHTRGPNGLPISGFAIAACRQDSSYVREERGFADVSIKQITVTE